ncbi:hypothetical protein EDD18DRAFT_1463029 [Armillaria luteobubalina]|uniref:Uncharacterized protein n=1 Tax=Armillaria luteobubalina TaxID=153913 RepID=A0AA39Q3X1_9AGAR|nr:hypothetical protein EDD18DRAFT_1463029 [Armillaria luteobubalina]
MNATNAMFHLDAVARFVPEPVFPPDALNYVISDILRATQPFLDADGDLKIPNIEDLRRQVLIYDTLLNHIDEIISELQSHRDAVHKATLMYAYMLAPIRHLPVDILRIVFLALKAIILRSEQCLLNIVFQLDLDHYMEKADKSFAMILEESCRWKTLELQIPSCSSFWRLKGAQEKWIWQEISEVSSRMPLAFIISLYVALTVMTTSFFLAIPLIW